MAEVLSDHVALPTMEQWLERVRALGPAVEDGPTGADLVAEGRRVDDRLIGR